MTINTIEAFREHRLKVGMEIIQLAAELRAKPESNGMSFDKAIDLAIGIYTDFNRPPQIFLKQDNNYDKIHKRECIISSVGASSVDSRL